jgi:hypothetical protein
LPIWKYFSNIKYAFLFHLPHPTSGAMIITNLPLFCHKAFM